MSVQDGTNPRVKAAIYVPHGAIPDKRGFAPAIVAWEFAHRLRTVNPYVISARESFRSLYEVLEGIPVYRIHEGLFYRRLFHKVTRLDPWPLYRRAASIVRHHEANIFHAFQLEFPVTKFLKHLEYRIPVLVHAEVTSHFFDSRWGVADRYIAACGYIRERLIAKGYPADRIEVVYNGVDTEVFSPPRQDEREVLRRQYGIPESAVVLAFAGRKQEVKGFHVFLRVAKYLSARYRDLFIVAVGPEPDSAVRERTYSERKALRQQLTASGRYLEIPPLPHALLADIFRACDIMLLPSLSEPQGMVMIEALASGAVTISSNTGGVRESIRHGETGFLLEHPEQLEEVIDQVEDVLGHLDSMGGLRAAARADMVTRFDWGPVTERLEWIYQDVIGKARAI